MKKITVTIGVPAYNEEGNIENFLRSLFEQRLENIDLKEVLVYSDASSDKTNSIVEKVSKEFPEIILLKGKDRKGKYFRVNELFHLVKNDVLVVLDADIALVGDNFLEKLVISLIDDKKAAMISAHVTLVRPKGIIPRIIFTTFIIGDFMRLSIPGYDVAANFHGAATAYKKSFVQRTVIPANLSDPHFYIYLAAKKINGFRYAPDAAILQLPPTTFKDVSQMMRRSIGKQDPELEKIFGKEMIQEVTTIPTKAKLQGVIKCFMKYPFYTPLAMLISFYLGRIARPGAVDKSPVWEINTSTKGPITYEK